MYAQKNKIILLWPIMRNGFTIRRTRIHNRNRRPKQKPPEEILLQPFRKPGLRGANFTQKNGFICDA